MLKRSAVLSNSEELQIVEFGYEDTGKLSEAYMGIWNFYVIIYVLEGAGYFNGERLEAGEGFITKPLNRVNYFSDARNPWKCFWIVLDGNSVEGICKKYMSPNIKDVFTYDFRFGLADFIGTHFMTKEILTETHALYLFFYLMSKHETRNMSDKNLYVEQAKIFIHLYFGKSITVKDIAAAVKVSDRYLYNLFIKHLNISPKQMLSDVRIRRAETLLSRTDLPISEVSEAVGYSDPLAFSRFFSKVRGISPSAFRNEIKKKPTAEII